MIRRSFILAIVTMCVYVSAIAQSFSGNLTGRILDPQEGAVANATITLKNIATGGERRGLSDNEGNYTFVSITPGKYTVRAEASGFSAGSVTVEISIGSALRADVLMSVKGAQEVVTITAAGESGIAVQTDNAIIGTNITQQQVMELPSLTRNPYDFMVISAGAAPSSDGRGIGLAVNGQRSSSGTFILDGGENNDTFVAGVGQAVPMDSVQEYKVQTNNYTAEYGRSAGFIANVVTKSGTNRYHGSAYLYNRNSALAANGFENNAIGAAKTVFNRNQFGGTIGGPIKKDKILFFGSFEPILVRSYDTRTYWVPTPELLANSSPGTRSLFEKYPAPSSGFLSTAPRKLCPYPGNYRKVTDPVTEVVTEFCDGADFKNIQAFGRTSVVAPADAGAGNPQNTYLASARIDYNISEQTQLFGRYAFEDRNVFVVGNVNPYSTTLYQPEVQRNNNILLNLTRTWSGSLVTESRVVYNRLNGPNNPAIPSSGVIPTFTIDGETARLPRGASSFGGPQNIYQFMQTVNWIKGRHNIKFGGQYMHLRDNRTFGAYESAEARFGNIHAFAAGKISAYTVAIDPKGAFPGGNVTGPIGPPSFTRHFQYNEPSLFIQDTWKITPRLTITPGLRWEYFGVLHSPESEKSLDANFYYGEGKNIYEKVANGKFMRTIDAPGEYKNHFYKPQYKDFGPRFGIAYDLFGDGKTSVRSGFGIFYDRNFGNVLYNAIQNPPNYGTVRLTNVAASSALYTNQYTPFGSSTVLGGTSARHLNQDMTTSYVMSWNASVEHELSRKYVLGFSYIGSRGNGLYSLNNINRIGSKNFIEPCTVTSSNLCRLNPNASSINTRGNMGESAYYGLQFKIDSRRIEKLGLSFGANYTFSRSTDNNSSFFGDDAFANPIGFGFTDAFNGDLDKGPSDFDIRHRVASHFSWELPIAKHSTNAFAKNILNGWQMTGILTFQTGQPFSIFDSGVADYSVEAPRVTITGKTSEVLSNPTPDAKSANTFLLLPINGAFGPGNSVNGPFTGISPRNTFRRPGTHFENISFIKKWSLTESVKMQLRSEFYNIFNHANLYMTQFTNDIASSSFNISDKESVPAVTAYKSGRRQIVIALRFEF